ncbi:DUF4864 domain-containing protein [Halobium salinum]|uniref:DUF4864 domain-containing protein n=1 Tax=Halobium salinum TaxID=1364940 RepID=A0ABD5P9V2_9EURY|nr:DUF4864 domain-containing protein [Halobium salinum]
MSERSVNAGVPRPDPLLSPADVVQLGIDALRENDAPYADRGVETVYAFTTPAVRRATGPFTRFTGIVHRNYRPLLDIDRAGTTPVEQSGDRASQEVTVVAPDGDEAVYEFRLARQSGGADDGCWLVDGVSRIA